MLTVIFQSLNNTCMWQTDWFGTKQTAPRGSSEGGRCVCINAWWMIGPSAFTFNDMVLLGDAGAEGVEIFVVGVDGAMAAQTRTCLAFLASVWASWLRPDPQLPHHICVCTGDFMMRLGPYVLLFTPSRYCLAHSAVDGNKARGSPADCIWYQT